MSGTSTPMNWIANIDQVVRGYETSGKGLVHGLQKDAIQNSWGHKEDTENGTGWSVKFELISNDLGTFLLIQDIGTKGMTGPNLSTDEINKYNNDLNPDYRLARFSSMNYSGGNDGAGLFGRGKLLFNAASSNYSYIYETITKEDGNRANWKWIEGKDLRMEKQALEGEGAKKIIREKVGIEPISEQGSRIIIINPKDEIVTAIKDGTFLRDIEETWWRIVSKYDAKITVAFDGQIYKADIPAMYKDALESKRGWKSWKKHSISSGYKNVKSLGLFVSDQLLPEELEGIYVYRKDMKVGVVKIDDVPQAIRGKYFGFVEVDETWEEELAEIENVEHYGFNTRKRAYQSLKNLVNTEHRYFMDYLGLGPKKQNRDELLQKEFEEVSNELGKIFDELDINFDGTGETEKPVEVVWDGVNFPTESNVVKKGDLVEDIYFKIKNNSGAQQKVSWELYVECDDNVVLKINKDSLNVSEGKEERLGPFDFMVHSPLIPQKKHYVKLKIQLDSTKKIFVKEMPFYYETKPYKRPLQNFNLRNINLIFPNDSNRVNPNEEITDLKYLIKNNLSTTAYISFHLTTHNAEERNSPRVEDLYMDKSIIIPPNGEKIINCPNILFDSSKYQVIGEKGTVEIRASISATRDFDMYEISEELCRYSRIFVNYNKDGGNGFQLFEEFHLVEEKDGEKRKSYLTGDQRGWEFNLNIVHPVYINLEHDETRRKDYIHDEMLKQIVMALLKIDNSTLFTKYIDENLNIDDLSNIEIVELINRVFDAITFDRYKGEVHYG
ncbi:hypothetical protein GCM10011351_26960 [Paraliobacillus quinghaiensis]|uniref:Uncharacterized protein n=1 Tax=Paraliobacillus quinghaiensis TaxID=470815 RepID=A0A917WY23_9BACI|nr:hypothetical protein [Paraliobacillus quinghaiensis]GGM39416.1 hypothetical protein GCM10011351_26960 [Paraliobacillus quinghaiensis]